MVVYQLVGAGAVKIQPYPTKKSEYNTRAFAQAVERQHAFEAQFPHRVAVIMVHKRGVVGRRFVQYIIQRRKVVAIQGVVSLQTERTNGIGAVAARKQSTSPQIERKHAARPIQKVLTQRQTCAPAIELRADVRTLVSQAAIDTESPPAAIAGRKVGACLLGEQLGGTKGQEQ